MPTTTAVKGAGGKTLEILGDGSIPVTQNTFPVLSKSDETSIFRQYLKNEAGSSDMLVDGSTDNELFFISADVDDDIYITSLSFVIADAGSTLNKFGNIAALTNGCEFFYESTSGNIVIHDALKTNFDFVRLCNGNPAFGDGTGAFRAGNVSGTSEAYLPTFDTRVFGFPFGIRLRAGTEQRIALKIKDDCTGIDQFDIIAYGFRRLKLDD